LSDQIVLPTIDFNSHTFSFSGGILTIRDLLGTTVAAITFVGSPNLPNLKFAIDPTGGTLITDPPASTTTAVATTTTDPSITTADAATTTTDASTTKTDASATTTVASTATTVASTTTTDATVTPVAKTSTKTTSSQTKAASVTVTETASSRTNATLAAVDGAVLVALNTAVVVAATLDNAAADTDAGVMPRVTISGNGTAADITDAVSGSDSSLVNSGAAL